MNESIGTGARKDDCPDGAARLGHEKVGKVRRVTKDEREAQNYLSERHIGEFFGFLMGHLVTAQPDDPVAYLFDLLDKCLLFRAGLVEPPLLFAPRHIESVYRSLDPVGAGHISLVQCEAGMKSMGIKNYDRDSMRPRCGPPCIDKEAFQVEAKRCLTETLKEMVREPEERHR